MAKLKEYEGDLTNPQGDSGNSKLQTFHKGLKDAGFN